MASITEEDEYQRGSHLYVRGVNIDLGKVDNVAARRRETANIKYLHIYCDTLLYTGPLDQRGFGILDNFLGQSVDKVSGIQIYARTFMPNRPEMRGLRYTNPNPGRRVTMTLVAEIMPPNFILFWNDSLSWELLSDLSNCSSPGTCTYEHSILTNDTIGHAFTLSDRKATLAALTAVPRYEVEPLSAPELLAFGPDYAKTSNLIRLLHHLFVLAGQALVGNEAEQSVASSRLRFILRCTRDSTANINLAFDAKTLLNRIELPKGGFVRKYAAQQSPSFLPKFKTNAYTAQIQSDIEDLDKIEVKIRNGQAHAELVDLAKKSLGQTGALWQGLGLVVRTTVRESQRNWDLAAQALQNVQNKTKDLEQEQGKAETASNLFQQALDAYVTEEEFKAQKAKWFAALEIGVAVVGCIASGGASAPATIGKVQQIVSGTFQAAGKFTKLAQLLLSIAKKLAPMVKKLQDVFGKQKAIEPRMTESLQQIRQQMVAAPAGSALTSAGSRLDVLGLLADWKDFSIDVDLMFKEIETVLGDKGPLTAMNSYKAALQKQIVRGETLVLAARDSEDALERFLKQEAEYEARDKREQELKDLATLSTTNDAAKKQTAYVADILLKQELAASKRRVFVNMHRGMLSLIFRTNNPYNFGGVVNAYENRKLFSPDLSMGEFRDLSKNLTKQLLADEQAASAQNFEVSATDPKYLDPNWKDLLVKSGRIPFEIGMDLDQALIYYRARIEKVKATFHGLKIPLRPDGKPRALRYTFEFGPQMRDRDSSGTVVRYWTEPQFLTKSGDANEWDVSSGEFITPTLFCKGQIWISAKDNPDFDLTQITGVDIDIIGKGISIAPREFSVAQD